MNKKKRTRIVFAVSLTLLLSLIIHIGAHTCYQNVQLGTKVLSGIGPMQHSSLYLAKSIDELEKEFVKADYDLSRVNTVCIEKLDYYLIFSQYEWGYGDMPISYEVRMDYQQRIEALRQIRRQGHEALIEAFSDEEKAKEITLLTNQLYLLFDSLTEFYDRYQQMTPWERYVVNWKDVHIQLTDKVRIPTTK